MPRIRVTCRNSTVREVDAPPRGSLMLALKGGGISEIEAICGGCASRGTCHVYVAQGWLDRLPPIGPDEDTVLAFSDWREPNSRLACQISVTDALDGLCVTVAPED